MNLCLFSGRLTKTPQLEMIENIPRVRFTLAVRRSYKNKKGEYEYDFIYIIAWRKRAEYIASRLKQGDMVEVSCTMRIELYEKNGEQLNFKSFDCNGISLLAHPHPKSTVEEQTCVVVPDEEIPEDIAFRFSDNVNEIEE